MARRNKDKPAQQVNKVRRKASDEELQLGSKSALPEEVIKKHRKPAKPRNKKGVKKTATEDITPHKGRAHKQEKVVEKTKQDLRKRSEVEKEYTKQLRKLRARLRYREKQGYFVKWETLPSRPLKPTYSDLAKLSQYAVQLNDLNEIELVRTEYNKEARDLTAKLRIKYKDTPNYTIENDPNFVPPAESVQHFDVFDRIERAFLVCINEVNYNGTELDHFLDDEKWVELSNGVIKAYYEAYDIFLGLRDSPKRQQYADYLYNHENEVTEAIDVVRRVSTQDQLDTARSDMLRYIEMH